MTIVLHMLDTDTASFIIKHRSPAIAARLAELPPDRVCVSAVTRAELLYGLKKLPSAHRLHVAVQRFLGIVRVLSMAIYFDPLLANKIDPPGLV